MINIQQIQLRYGHKIIFDEVSATIESRDRIGLVGSNGSGKSTFLKVLLGEESLDAGDVAMPAHATVGYLPQDGLEAHGRSLYTEVESAAGNMVIWRDKLAALNNELAHTPQESKRYHELLHEIGDLEHKLEFHGYAQLKPRIFSILRGLGFKESDGERDTKEFSGGWQMRIALAKLLLRQPDLLLLDEPTNHLDLPAQRWLENYLLQYPGAFILISHDRAFLDTLTTKTFALSLGNLSLFRGNYSFYEKENALRKEILENAYKSQQKKLEKTQAFIERFRYKATKAKQVQSRVKALEKEERIELEDEESSIGFNFPSPPASGNLILEMKHLSKAYGSIRLFDGYNLRIEKGERIAVVGANGCGKSTLARMLAGVEAADSGERVLGHNAVISYFAQNQTAELNPEHQVLEAVEDLTVGAGNTLPRTVLGAFLFRGEDVFKKVAVLSGGEKNRLALARMLLKPANFLILDEPTNHLDMRSKQMLQEALLSYGGGFLIVSHDRAFLDPLVTKVIEIGTGQPRLFLGNVSDYLRVTEAESLNVLAAQTKASAEKNNTTAVESEGEKSVLSAQERRRLAAEKRERLKPLKQKIEVAEKRISELEKVVSVTETEMLHPDFYKDQALAQKKLQSYQAAKSEIDQLTVTWEELLLELEACEE